MIYLDNAATTYQKPRVVIEAVAQAMTGMGNAGRGAHECSLGAARVIYETRVLLAELFGLGDAGQIAFTANATESLNIAIQGLFQPGDHVITTAMEHNSVLRPLYLMEQRGISITILPVDRQGRLSYQQMEAAVRPETRGIVCTHVSNLTGNVVDLKRVGKISENHHLKFVLDASQSAGVFEIDMRRMNIDVVCFTGHKSLLGPQGIGGIAVRKGTKIQPLVVGGSGLHSFNQQHPQTMPEALEAGTLNGHGIAGLHAALLYLRDLGIETIRSQELALAEAFYRDISTVSGVKVYGDLTQSPRAPIVTINIGDYDSSEVADELQLTYGIAVRAGAHCVPLLHQALGTADQGAVRFSFSHLNTMGEVERAVRAVAEMARD